MIQLTQIHVPTMLSILTWVPLAVFWLEKILSILEHFLPLQYCTCLCFRPLRLNWHENSKRRLHIYTMWRRAEKHLTFASCLLAMTQAWLMRTTCRRKIVVWPERFFSLPVGRNLFKVYRLGLFWLGPTPFPPAHTKWKSSRTRHREQTHS